MKILDKSGCTSAALDAGKHALNISPNNIDLLKVTADLLSYQGQFNESLAARKIATDMAPENVDALNAHARQLLVMGEKLEARLIFLKILELSPANASAMEQLSSFQTPEQNAEMRKIVDGALATCERKDPDRRNYLFTVARIAQQAGEGPTAAKSE